jgi:hypothetical protein
VLDAQRTAAVKMFAQSTANPRSGQEQEMGNPASISITAI